MARSNQQKQKRKQQKIRQRKAKAQKRNVGLAEIIVPQPSAKIARKIYEVHEAMDEGDVELGLELLNDLVRLHPKNAAVAETETTIYQQFQDHERCCQAADRFLSLVPKNPDALFSLAQAEAFCGRSSLAYVAINKFIARWPNHEFSHQANKLLDVCEQESRNRIDDAKSKDLFDLEFENGGLEFFARHEKTIELLSRGETAQAIPLIEKNIEVQPKFISSRNNLAICYFYQGHFQKAVDSARDICELYPDNRFAQANLIKFEFLIGNFDQANELAEVALADPPTEQDAYAALVESLGFLGRDEDILVISQLLQKVTPIDDDKKSMVLHNFAVANHRMGDEKTAHDLWDQSLNLFPGNPTALENMRDLDVGIGHAAWYEPLTKWLPQSYLLKVTRESGTQSQQETGGLSRQFPTVASLVPALLDRGDPYGRELAYNFAHADGSPPMLQALRDFALGKRGPDSMRHAALIDAQKENLLDSGLQRFYSRGKWTDIKLMAAEIYFEPIDSDNEPWKTELLENGHYALEADDLFSAEEAFSQILDRDPECRSARFNRAAVWQKQGTPTAVERACEEIQDIYSMHPDYSFGIMAMAILQAEQGNFVRAGELLLQVAGRARLHISEAKMLFATQVQVALAQDLPESAETAWFLLCDLLGEDDLIVEQLRMRIDTHDFNHNRGFLNSITKLLRT